MENLLFSIQVVAPLVLLMVAGYAGAKYNILSPVFLTEANKFVFKFSLPFMLFLNVSKAVNTGEVDMKLIYTCLITIVAMITLCCLFVPIFVKRNGQRGSMIQAIYRSNFLIYGIPLGISMYGEAAMMPIAMAMAVSIPFYNISAVFILAYFSENRTSKMMSWQSVLEVLKNPLIIGCAVGVLFGLLDMALPRWLDIPIKSVGDVAMPLALIVMGGQFKFRDLHKNIRMVVSATVLRLVVIPFVALSVFIWLGFRGAELCALFCLFATPTAVVSHIMSENMGCDGELSAQIIVLTTALSAFTIFGFVFWLKTIGVL
ncbi:MAG: AEC family transporter [Prevotellaceae bacterium]|jgi:predicted permease|nr:AEC family transporter [Prevotellaceae bacterium]